MNHTDDMDYADFIETGTNLANRIMDRVPQRWRPALAGDIEDGIQEPKFFMSLLMRILTEDHIPITPEERDTVIRLMTHRKMDLTPAETFNVTNSPTPQQPPPRPPN